MSPNFDRGSGQLVRLADVTSTSALLPPVARPRLGVVVDYADDFRDAVADVVEYEALGADLVTVSEAYSFDAVSKLGFLAARTERITLAAAILPIYSRTPTLMAMTAATLDTISGGRFELGLGASGPQVIEGFHGVPFSAPLARTREIIEIARSAWRGDRVEHSGRHYTIPLPADQGTGLGKPLKMIGQTARQRIPIYIAALAPKGVAQAAEIAEGWIPLFFHPELGARVWGAPVAEGLARRDASLPPLELLVQLPVYVGPGHERALEGYRARAALYIGGMGAKGANFYNAVVASMGFEAEAERIQDLYLAGDKAGAAAAVPEELLRATALIGDEEHVRERVGAFRAAGVSSLVVQPLAPSREARIAHVAAVRGMLDELD